MNTALQQPASTALAAAPSFAVPFADLTEFASLPETRRTEIHYTLRILERLHGLIATKGKMAALAETCALHRHAMRGLSVPSLDRKYKAYLTVVDRETGDIAGWRSLIKGYKAPSQQPDAFVQEVRRLAELNHRSQEEAFEQLREQWQRGDTIPGYGTWMDRYMSLYPERPMPKVWPRGFYPKGWSVRNLRRYGPTKGARVLFQRGVLAAKKHFPSVKRDPSSLRPLELITIDDFELDALCVFPGDAKHKPQIARVAGLLAIDVGTRRKLHWGLGQAIERVDVQPDGTTKTVRTGIARIDVQMLIFSLFEKYGLPDYQVTILCENASASISAELQLCLETLFEGRVRIARTGMIDHKNLTNGFAEKGGKPFEKGWIEAAFNQLWNYLGAMKGYKGANMRLDKPAGIDDAILYTKILIGQGETTPKLKTLNRVAPELAPYIDKGTGAVNLPPEKIAQLRLPFQSLLELERAFAWACELSDTRTKHNYIGFRTVTEYQIEEGADPVPFQHLALLSEAAMQLAVPVPRMESTLERWVDLCREVTFQPIPRIVLALLLLTPKKVSYRNHAVTFTHDGQGYTYLDKAGTVLRGLIDGTELLAYFNPAAPDTIQLVDLRGNHLGELIRLGGRNSAVDIKDKDGLSTAAALTATIFNREVADLRKRHASENEQVGEERAGNAAIVAAHKAETAGFTKAERIGVAAGEKAQAAAETETQEKALQRSSKLDATKLF
ncbi:MAG TPA: hypothetical protein VK985_09460 [Rariglobus sp.]|nr:hypothetical protein [Rariglobus sp.]